MNQIINKYIVFTLFFFNINVFSQGILTSLHKDNNKVEIKENAIVEENSLDDFAHL